MLKNIFLISLFCIVVILGYLYVFPQENPNPCEASFLSKQPKAIKTTNFYEYETDSITSNRLAAFLLNFSQEKNGHFSMLFQCQFRDTIQYFLYKEPIEEVFQLKISWKQRQNDTLSRIEDVKINKINVCSLGKRILKYKVDYKDYRRHTIQKSGRVTVQEFVIYLKYFIPNVGGYGKSHFITLYNK